MDEDLQESKGSDSPSKKMRMSRDDLTNSGSSFPPFIKTRTQNYFVTVPAGLEFLAEEEIREKLSPSTLKR